MIRMTAVISPGPSAARDGTWQTHHRQQADIHHHVLRHVEQHECAGAHTAALACALMPGHNTQPRALQRRSFTVSN